MPQLTNQEIEEHLRSSDPDVVSAALLSPAPYDPDYRRVQARCLALLAHRAIQVRAAAITGLGHLARIHRSLDLGRILPALLEAKKDSVLAGRIDDALDDIRLYQSSG